MNDIYVKLKVIQIKSTTRNSISIDFKVINSRSIMIETMIRVNELPNIDKSLLTGFFRVCSFPKTAQHMKCK